MTHETVIEWGGPVGRYGYMYRRPFDRRYWTGYFTADRGVNAPDGQMQYRGGVWSSDMGKHVSVPYAVMDDLGDLAPVESPWTD